MLETNLAIEYSILTQFEKHSTTVGESLIDLDKFPLKLFWKYHILTTSSIQTNWSPSNSVETFIR